MTWFFLALLSTFFFTLYALLARILSVKSKNPRAFSLVYNFFCSLFVLGLWLIEGESLKPITPFVIFLTFIAITLWGLFNRVEYFAHKYMEVSLRTIISKTAELTTFFAATLFLREVMTFKKLLAVSLIVGASVFALYKKNKIIKTKGLIYTLLTSIFLGLAWTMDKKVSVYYPTSFYVLLGYSLASLYIIPFPTLSFNTVKKEFKRANWKVVLLAFINVLGYYTLIKSFAYGEASKIVLIVASRSVFTILAGIVILKEKSNIFKKIMAGLIVSLGILLLK